MIMALGESGHIESLDFLLQLTEQEFEATMIYVAIGDAVTSIQITNNILPTSLGKWIDNNRRELVNGGLRSIATRQIIPNEDDIQKIIRYVSLLENREIQFWAVAAAPGWPKKLTTTFLKHMAKSAYLEDTKKAAKAALNGNYLKWNPL